MKSILSSKTIWVALASLILALLDFVDALDLPAAEQVLLVLAPVVAVARTWRSNIVL